MNPEWERSEDSRSWRETKVKRRKNVKLRAWDEVTALPRLVFFFFRIIFSLHLSVYTIAWHLEAKACTLSEVWWAIINMKYARASQLSNLYFSFFSPVNYGARWKQFKERKLQRFWPKGYQVCLSVCGYVPPIATLDPLNVLNETLHADFTLNTIDFPDNLMKEIWKKWGKNKLDIYCLLWRSLSIGGLGL